MSTVSSTKVICNIYKNITLQEAYAGEIGIPSEFASDKVIRIITTIDTLDEFKASLANCKLYYILETPIETTLTPQEVQDILSLTTYKPTTIALNSAGATMSITYRADTKNYIDQKIQMAVNQMLSSSLLNMGENPREESSTEEPTDEPIIEEPIDGTNE